MKLFRRRKPTVTYWKLECKPTGKMLLYKNGQRIILKNYTLLFTTEFESDENGQPNTKEGE